MIERFTFWGLLLAALILFLWGCAERPHNYSKRELIEGITK